MWDFPILNPVWRKIHLNSTYFRINWFPKGSQPWISIGRTDAEVEVPIIWPPDSKSRLTGKDPEPGKVWGQEEKRTTENEMVGWHHWLNGNEFQQTPGDGEGQGSLTCCSPRGAKSPTRLNDWTTIMPYKLAFNPNTPKALTALIMSFCMKSSLKTCTTALWKEAKYSGSSMKI